MIDPLFFRLLRDFERAESDDEFADLLYQIESATPISGTCPEMPWFTLVPPSLKPPQEWAALLKNFSIPRETLHKMLESAFMPLDLRLLDRRTFGNSFFAAIVEIGKKRGWFSLDECHVPLDVGYGVAPLAPDKPSWYNVAFTKQTVERYAKSYPEVKANPNYFLSLGALRRARVSPIHRPESWTWVPDQVAVSTRRELDALVDTIREQAAAKGYQLWLRGQTKDFGMPSLGNGVVSAICPWRMVPDSSLIPSLYRRLPALFPWREKYKRFCREYAFASLYLNLNLFPHAATVRMPTEPPKEWLDSEWFRSLPVPMPTAVRIPNDGGSTSAIFFGRPSPEFLASLPAGSTVHDYHPVFRSLQSAFFMQHYGLPSNLLDVTSDLDVALFFAQHDVENGNFVALDSARKQPVMLLFLVDPNTDVFLDSQSLAESFQMLRPIRQRCGVLAGASMINRNDYARLISAKIFIKNFLPTPPNFDRYLFPSPSEDPFLEALQRFARNEQFQWFNPWARAEPPGK